MAERGTPRPELAGLTLSLEERDDVEVLVTGKGGGVGLLDRIDGALNTGQMPEQEFRDFFENDEYKTFTPSQREFAQRLLMSALANHGGVDVGAVMAKYRELISSAGTPPRAHISNARGSTPPPPPAPATAGTKRPTPGAQPAGAGGPQPQRPGGGGGQRGGGGKDGGGGREAQLERAKLANPRNFSAVFLEREYGRMIRRDSDGKVLYGAAPSEAVFRQELRDHLRTEFPSDQDQYSKITDAVLDEYVDGWLRLKLASLPEHRDKGQKGEKEPKKAEAEKQQQKRDNPAVYALEFLNGHASRIEYNEKTGKAGPLNNRTIDALKQELVEKLRLEFPLPEFASITDVALRDHVDTWYRQTVTEKEIQAAVRKMPKKPEERIEERVKAIKEKLRLIGYGEELDTKTVEQDFGNESKEKALHKIVQKLLSKDVKDEPRAKADLFATVGTKYGLSEKQCADIYDALKLELITSAQAQEKIKGKFWRIFRPHTRQGKITKAAAFAGAGVASTAGFGWLGLVATGGVRAIDRFVTGKVDTKLLNQYRERNKRDDNFLKDMQGRLAGLIVETKRRGLEAEHAKERARQQTAPQLIQETFAARIAYNSAETARQAAEQKAIDARTARETVERYKNNLPALKTAQKTTREALTAAEEAERAAHDALQNARLHSPPNFPAIEQRHQAAGVATVQARTAFDNANRLFIAAKAEAEKFKAAQKTEQETAKAFESTRIATEAAKKQHDELVHDLSQLGLVAPLDAQELREQTEQAERTEREHQHEERASMRYFVPIFNYLRRDDDRKLDARLRMDESELRGVAERLAVYYVMDDLADAAERAAEEKRKFLTLPEQIPFSKKLNALFSKRLTALIGKIPSEKPRDFALAGVGTIAGTIALGLTIIKGIRYTSPLASRLAGAYEGWKLGKAVHETGARLSPSERIEKEIVAAEALRKLMENKDKPNARLQALDDLETTLGQLSVRLAEFPKETNEGAKFLAWKEKVRELTLAVVTARFEKREDDTTQDSFDAITERLEKLKKSQIEAVTAKNKTFSEKTWREKGAALLPSAELAKKLAKKLTGAAAGLALAEAGINLADLR